MAFHYQRTPWDGGGVSRLDGDPAGSRLTDLLASGLPPLKVGLEIAASCCEIMYIAHDDGVQHGDPMPADAWLSGDGIVSIGGFGLARKITHAPEGRPLGPQTDLYGLGRLCALVLVPGSNALDDAPRSGATAHDEAVSRFVQKADLGEHDPVMLDDVRWFISWLLAFDRARRPEVLRTWRSMIAFARTVPGPDLSTWAADAHRGTAERRTKAGPAAIEPLGGARAKAGPVREQLSFSSQDPKTTFWTKAPEPEPPPEPARPAPSAGPAAGPPGEAATRGAPRQPEPGGGERTGYWTRGELMAMAKEAIGAPAPARTPKPRMGRENPPSSASAAAEEGPRAGRRGADGGAGATDRSDRARRERAHVVDPEDAPAVERRQAPVVIRNVPADRGPVIKKGSTETPSYEPVPLLPRAGPPMSGAPPPPRARPPIVPPANHGPPPGPPASSPATLWKEATPDEPPDQPPDLSEEAGEPEGQMPWKVLVFLAVATGVFLLAMAVLVGTLLWSWLYAGVSLPAVGGS